MPQPNGDLAGNAMGGAGKMALGQLARIGLQLLGFVLLARLLSPEDYGLVAMVLAIIAIAEVLRDFGLTFASVQSREMSPALRSNLFWINTAAGVIAAAAVIGASWPIAAMYGDPRLVELTWALAPIYLLNSLAAQYQADLNRHMRFGPLVVADVTAGVLGLGGAIVAAIIGMGYWSLAVQHVLTALALLVGVVLAGRWVPRWYDRTVSVRSQVGFGMTIFFSQIVNYAARNADAIIIGIRLEAAAVGFYDRAFQLYNVAISRINAPATRVALPVLSKLQDDPAEFRRFILKGQLGLMHPVMFLMACGTAFGALLVPFVLGGQWEASGLLFQILCVGGLAQAANYSIYWCYLATGMMGENLKLMIVYRPLTIGFLLIGSIWDAVGVAVAFVIGQVGGWLLQIWWSRRIPVAPRIELVQAALRGWLLYFVPAVAGALCVEFFGLWPGLPLGIVCFGAGIGLVLLIYPRLRSEVRISIAVGHGIVRRTLRRRRR